MILSGECMNFMLEIFSSFHEIRLNYFQSTELRYHNTIQYRFPVFLTLPSHLVAATYFIPFGKWGEVRHLSLKIERDAAKN